MEEKKVEPVTVPVPETKAEIGYKRVRASRVPNTIVVTITEDGIDAVDQSMKASIDPGHIAVLLGDEVIFESDLPTTVRITTNGFGDAVAADLFASDADTLAVPSVRTVEAEGYYTFTAGSHTGAFSTIPVQNMTGVMRKGKRAI